MDPLPEGALPPSSPEFFQAISRILKSWTALQLSIDHGLGGPESREKGEWLVYAIDTWFQENKDIYPDEVVGFLEEVLTDLFEALVEDDSMPEIARLICYFYRLCQDKNYDELNAQLAKLPKASLDTSQIGASNDPDEPRASRQEIEQIRQENNRGTEHESTNQEPEIDEDGFQTVRSNKKKR